MWIFTVLSLFPSGKVKNKERIELQPTKSVGKNSKELLRIKIPSKPNPKKDDTSCF